MAIRPTRTQEEKRMDALLANGGVGQNVGLHNEIFNAYASSDKHTITPAAGSYDYNHAEGYKNTLTACKKTHGGGDQNSVTAGNSSIISGIQNTATPGNLSPAEVWASIISGNINVVHGIIASMVLGQNNSVNDLVNSLVLGQEHTIANNHVVGGAVLGIGANTASVPSGRAGYILVGANTSQIGNTFSVDIGGFVDAYRFIPQGADYAEYFEWADGNPDNEDRRGLLVALSGDKIDLAHADEFFGIVSANPSVVGNAASLVWQGRFKRDVFGAIIRDEDGKPVINPDFDESKEYIPREVRPEWSAIGLVGRLVIIDDGSCKDGGYVSARHGIGTACFAKTAARVLKRIDDTHIEVLIR